VGLSILLRASRENPRPGFAGRGNSLGAERGRFAADDIDLKVHNITCAGLRVAITRWKLTGIMDLVEDYRELLQPWSIPY